MVEIGQIEEVSLRELWEHEAHDFTPWLADNLSLLGDALGLSLEFTEREAASGGYSLDILAKDTYHDCNVVIENQLEFTDHGHLGQLITYATLHDARIAIWVSSGFHPEHRAAIDWLNKWMSDEIDFYAVEVRSIRIDGSRPAVEFRPVAYPEWQDLPKRRGRGQSKEKVSDAERELCGQFFAPLIRELADTGWKTKGDPWYDGGIFTGRCHAQEFESEFPGIGYLLSLESDGHAYATLWVHRNGSPRQVYDALLGDLESVKDGLGVTDDGIIYHCGRGKSSTSAYFGLVGPEASLDDDAETQDTARDWMRDATNRLWEVLTPRIQEILGDEESEC